MGLIHNNYPIMATQRRPFRPDEIEYAWQQAIPVDGFNPDVLRKDYAGAYIAKDAYGDRSSAFGWEVDHIIPLEKNGPYEEWNYAPLHWENNNMKDDNFPVWETKVAFMGTSNHEYQRNWFGAVFDHSVKIIGIK